MDMFRASSSRRASLMTPPDSLGCRLEVRILSDGPFQYEDAYSYPEEQGWGRRSIREWQELFDKPTKEFQAFFQRWLFSGLLTALIGESSILTMFLDGDDCQGQHHPLASFLRLVDAIILHFQDSSMGSLRVLRFYENYLLPVIAFHNRLAIIDTEDKILDPSVLDQERDLINFMMHPKDVDPRDPSDIVATAIMLEYFQRICISTFTLTDREKLPQKLSQLSQGIQNANIMWRILRNNGWCPFEIEVMTQRLSTTALHFMSNIRRPDNEHQHTVIRVRGRSIESGNDCPDQQLVSQEASSLCKPYRCSNRQLSDSHYETVHCSDCVGCFDVGINAGELEDILLQDKHNIPLVMSIDPEDSSNTALLVAAQPDTAYVAISHVWSDGLGNPRKNAIPHCQMVRLSKMVRSLPRKNENMVLFWLDTLCVPPDGTGQDNAQALALERMRETYESASAVLVLDKWLLSTAICATSDADLILRISISVWNRRLWTYQEAALARTLLFQLEDGIFDVDQAYARLLETEDRTLIHSLLGDVHTQYTSLRGFRRAGESLTAKIRGIIDACMLRATSVSTDEALCLGALLDLDISALLSAPAEDRMTKLFTLLPATHVPINILQFGDTQPNSPFRWAPRSLLASNWNLKSDMNFGTEYWDAEPTCGSVTPTGFRVEEQGLVFPSQYPLGVECHIKDDFGNWLNVRTYLVPGSDTRVCQHDVNGVVRERLKWEFPAETKVARIVFIPFTLKGFSERIFHKRGYRRDEDREPDSLTGYGMLGMLTGENENGDQCVRKICPASFLQITPSLGVDQLPSLELMASLFGIDTGVSAPGNLSGKHGDNQVLCVSRGNWGKQTWVID